jgi:hypothetical protein
MNSFSVQQYCRFSRESHKHRLFAFCLFILEDSGNLENVEEVEYTLDPSFPDPVRISRDKKHAFALQSEAWGSFYAHVRIFLNDGSSVREQHAVIMEENEWPLGNKLIDFESEAERLVYKELFDTQWEWRKLSTIVNRSRLDREIVQNILEKLDNRAAARKAYFQSIDKQDLWAATSVVGILPTPNVEKAPDKPGFISRLFSRI